MVSRGSTDIFVYRPFSLLPCETDVRSVFIVRSGHDNHGRLVTAACLTDSVLVMPM